MLSALGFLTILGRSGVPTARALPYFPIAGVLIGAAVGGVWWASGLLWPPLVAAALALIADAAITGMLHLDGLSDSADGLIAPMERERRLTVMRDPSVGAFGAVTLILTLLLRLAVLASVPANVYLLAALWCLSRAAMAMVTAIVPYARSQGLAGAFLGGKRAGLAAGGIGLALAVALGWLAASGLPGGAVPFTADTALFGLIPLAAAALAALAVTLFASRRLGGFTGDTLGATGVIAETVGLLAWAAW